MKRTKRRLAELLAFVLVLLTAPSGMADECLRYEPIEVTIAGTLARRTYPGPPNYEDIASGDAAEATLILKLSDPICVKADPSSELNTSAHTNLREVQVIPRMRPSDSLWGRRVEVTGTLFAAISGHHRTPVVLQAISIHAAEQAD